ncbi:hypothetical protein DL96DRAFT_1714562 [Flagelloscypha sp. PMI_526]|nr:hypothetical protein DL96DRAFT_1714562 [Flagelloscypha sp. PMI_526]
MTVLPIELYTALLSFLQNDKIALARCVLVDRAFRRLAQGYMWQTLRIQFGRRSLGHLYEKHRLVPPFRGFLAFLREDTSRHLLLYPSIAFINVEALGATGFPEEISSIFIQLISLRFLELYGSRSSPIPPGILRPLLEANTVCPKLDILRLRGFIVPLLDIMSARPHLRHLALDNVRTTRLNCIDKEPASQFGTALRTLTVDTYTEEELGSSSQLGQLVRTATRQGTLKALHLEVSALLRTSSLLKICASTLTTYRFGWQVFNKFSDNSITNNDLGAISLSHFTSLQALQFEIIIPLAQDRNTNPLPFLEWLTAEIQSVIVSQANHRVFASVLCDLKIPDYLDAVAPKIFSKDAGWRILDALLAEESVAITLRTNAEHLELLKSCRDAVFPLSSSKNLVHFECQDNSPGDIGLFINTAILRA